MPTKILTIDSPIVLNPNDVTVDSSSIPSGSIAISKNIISANINGEIAEFNASKYLILDSSSVKSVSAEGTDRLDITLTDDTIVEWYYAFRNTEANHNYLEVAYELVTLDLISHHPEFIFLSGHNIIFDEIGLVGEIGTDPEMVNHIIAYTTIHNHNKDSLDTYECQLLLQLQNKHQKAIGTLSFIKKPIITEHIFTIDGENNNNVETGDSLVLHGGFSSSDYNSLYSSTNRKSDAIFKLTHISGSALFNNLRAFMHNFQSSGKTSVWQGTLIKDKDIYSAYLDFEDVPYSLKLERLKKSSEDVILGYMAIGLQDTASLKSFYFAGDDRKNSAVIASTTSSTFPGKGTGYFDIDLTDAMTREEYDKISYMTAQVSLIDNVSGTDYVNYHIQVNKAKSSTRYGIKVLILNNNLTAYGSIPPYGGCVITFYK